MPGILDMIGSQAAPAPAELFVVGKPKGLLEAGNINVLDRPKVKLPDGGVATVHSMSFQDKNGDEVLVPMVSPDGKMMSQSEAVALYYKTGQHLGKFKTPDLATDYAMKLHDQQAQYYGIK
jgi:hypothetical protein